MIPGLSCTAYHEAGHAVMAIYLGYSVALVSIVPHLGENPRVEHSCAPGSKDHILISMAGNAAVDIFEPEGYETYEGGQRDAADYSTDLSALILDDGTESLDELDARQERLTRCLLKKTDRILRERPVKQAVKALAARLLEQKTMVGAVVHALVEPLLASAESS